MIFISILESETKKHEKLRELADLVDRNNKTVT